MNRSPAFGTSRLSRRAALRGAGATGLALTANGAGPTAGGATQDATPVSGQPFPNAIAAVMNQSRYAEYTQWGIYAADRETGEAVDDQALPGRGGAHGLWTGLPFPDAGLSPG